MRTRLVLLMLVVAMMSVGVPTMAEGPVASEAVHTEVFYPSGSLRIQAYIYKPDGDGPFPVVIYNHGSRDGRERVSIPQRHIGRMLVSAGYVVFVPERRGYGKSEGITWREEVRTESQLVPRLQGETDDVLAGVDYLHTLPFADTKRIGIMGWSFGGVVTMLAVSRSGVFAVAVDQAGGALSWSNSDLRGALIAAALKGTTPTLFLVAQNDRTVASIITLADIFKKRGIPHRSVIYAPWPPGASAGTLGHAIFSTDGAAVWEADVVEFLGRYLSPSR
jgi:dienelactone hydrolase